MTLLLQPGRMVDRLLGCFDLRGHVGEGEMHALEARHRSAELLPRGRVGHALLQGALRESQSESGNADAAPVERVEELPETVIDGTEDILFRDDRVLENELARVGGSPSQLVLFLSR